MKGRPTNVRYERCVTVPVPPPIAFALADMANLRDWNPAVRQSALESGPPLHPGSQYVCTVSNGPLRVTAHPRLADIQQDRLVVYEGQFGPAHSRDSIRFQPVDGGTRLTFTNVSTMPWWTAPLRRPITWLFHRQADRAVDGAVAHLAAKRAPRG